ncbi:MAG: transglycosylase SLT domain-containing protein [Chloroflexi bacterium]|nr:transglycosylase SLT domain-containing protein [Chloroflexota bacterium]
MKIAEPRLREVLRAAGWPERELNRALEIAYLESRWNPRAINKKDPSGGSYGLFQINGWWKYYGDIEIGEALDSTLALRPLYNARYALRIWRKRGWKAWSTARYVA